ncbi:hypothetical protein HJG60_009813 [Phyllostomus discolor]|uniref:Uncharacterized protein n=1 Tax=Phyllostomus discolor TaxID=89673 RepID=A0A834ELC8_9CHIR|nr:hypothetical protein HJG60_009813 [Phyllostomus discolor]
MGGRGSSSSPRRSRGKCGVSHNAPVAGRLTDSVRKQHWGLRKPILLNFKKVYLTALHYNISHFIAQDSPQATGGFALELTSPGVTLGQLLSDVGICKAQFPCCLTKLKHNLHPELRCEIKLPEITSLPGFLCFPLLLLPLPYWFLLVTLFK